MVGCSGVCYTEKSPEYPDQWYYMGEDGKFSVEENLAYQAAVDVYNKTYYEKYDKRMNSRYVFGDDGAMVTGWYAYKSTYGTTWCYADATGKAYDGWLEYAGKWYHIENGYMQTNQYVDGCWIGADGVWVK